MFDLERHFDRFEIDHFLFVEYFRVLLDHDMKTFLRLVWLTNCSTWLKGLKKYWQQTTDAFAGFFSTYLARSRLRERLVPGDEYSLD